MKRPAEFYGAPFKEVKWGQPDKPVLIVDGIKYPRVSLNQEIQGEFAYGVGLKDKEIQRVGEFLRVRSLSLYEIRASVLAPLAKMKTLERLSLAWSTKLIDLSFLVECQLLGALILSDIGKVDCIDPVSSLGNLKYLEVSGGIDKVAKFKSLVALSECKNLVSLCLQNIRVDDDDLQFVLNIKTLKSLQLSNQWPTQQYALLKKKLKGVECDYLQPWIKLSHLIGEKDVMVVGRGKPFLSSITDAEKIRKYEIEFENT